jgi:hypothetical protein
VISAGTHGKESEAAEATHAEGPEQREPSMADEEKDDQEQAAGGADDGNEDKDAQEQAQE